MTSGGRSQSGRAERLRCGPRAPHGSGGAVRRRGPAAAQPRWRAGTVRGGCGAQDGTITGELTHHEVEGDRRGVRRPAVRRVDQPGARRRGRSPRDVASRGRPVQIEIRTRGTIHHHWSASAKTQPARGRRDISRNPYRAGMPTASQPRMAGSAARQRAAGPGPASSPGPAARGETAGAGRSSACRLRAVRQFGPDDAPGAVSRRRALPTAAHGVDEQQSPAALVLGREVQLGAARAVPLVLYGYPQPALSSRSSHTTWSPAACTTALVTSSETTSTAVSMVSSPTPQSRSRSRASFLARPTDSACAGNSNPYRLTTLPGHTLASWGVSALPGATTDSLRWGSCCCTQNLSPAERDNRVNWFTALLSTRRGHLASGTLKIPECRVLRRGLMADCTQSCVGRSQK